MAKTKPMYDVFIAHGRGDANAAASIARALNSYDLRTFTESNVTPGTNVEDAIWEAIAESEAFIVVVPKEEASDAWTAVEVGAAKAWNKPIYAVASDPSSTRRIPFLKGTEVYTPSRIEEVAKKIKATSSAWGDYVPALIKEYMKLDVPLDKLMTQPKEVEDLTKAVNKSVEQKLASEELLRMLLRLRKAGKLRKRSKN